MMEDCCHIRTPILVDCMELHPHSRCPERGLEVDVYFVYLLSFVMDKIMDFCANKDQK